MDDEILIRVYNVGLGDCIYVRVPDGKRPKHILIDCGTFSRSERLQAVLNHVEKELPRDGAGKPQLDLLVVTHNHKDHLSGFGLKDISAWFRNAGIGKIWLSAGMNREHTQAKKTFRLLEFAERTAASLPAISPGPAFDGLAADLLGAGEDSRDEDNVRALTMLRKTLPGGKVEIGPVYLDDSMIGSRAPKFFSQAGARLHVLAPAYDIDGTYLGKLGDALAAFGQFQAQVGAQNGKSSRQAADLVENHRDAANRPANISAGEFRRLRERLIYQALAFVIKGNGELANNTSVVLLLEWRHKRLLFVGDAQCKTGRREVYVAGAVNGSWNAMWRMHKEWLDQPLAFLKVGHHGSQNATPWSADDARDPVNRILDGLIPPLGADCRVVVSTERTKSDAFKRSLPCKDLMMELGKRLRNPEMRYDESACYPDLVAGFTPYLVPPGTPQPMRTDLHQEGFVEVRIS